MHLIDILIDWQDQAMPGQLHQNFQYYVHSTLLFMVVWVFKFFNL
jgi:hypothetical protein